MLPRVIVHSMVSVDGRIDWFQPDVGLFYETVRNWSEDCTLAGSTTILTGDPQAAEDEGLVHFVDNTNGKIKHNCNCCGCACWNVGAIKRRKIPRDAIMEVYFVRETDEDECIGCGECVDICPVDALEMDDDRPVVDTDWCIGWIAWLNLYSP